MIRRSVSSLNLAKANRPCPTIEIHVKSLEKQGLCLSKIVSSALTRMAAENTKLRATIYMYRIEGTSFHELALSEFLIVVGSDNLLEKLYSALSIPKVKTRLGDHIHPSQGNPIFHIEDRLLWEPEDALTWYSPVDAELPVALAADIAAAETVEWDTPIPKDDEFDDEEYDEDEELEASDEDEIEFSDDSEFNSSDTTESGQGSARRSRSRAARADAKISRISKEIEKVFNLPKGSVALRGPDKRALRSDALIKTLRLRWETK